MTLIYMLPKYCLMIVWNCPNSVHDFVLCLTILESSNTRLREGKGWLVVYGGGQEVHFGSTNRQVISYLGLDTIKVLSHHDHSRERAWKLRYSSSDFGNWDTSPEHLFVYVTNIIHWQEPHINDAYDLLCTTGWCCCVDLVDGVNSFFFSFLLKKKNLSFMPTWSKVLVKVLSSLLKEPLLRRLGYGRMSTFVAHNRRFWLRLQFAEALKVGSVTATIM